MGISITEDLTIGSRYSRDMSGGSATRIFCVKGLPNASNMLYLAATAQDSTTNFRIPSYGLAHGTIPGIFCAKVSAEPWAQESRINAKVVCDYNWQTFSAGSYQVRLSGMRSVIRANRDPVTGTFFQVTYREPLPPQNAASSYALFDIYTSHLCLEITRIETISPKLKSAMYCGATNSDAGWQGIGGNYPGLWMCQNIDGETLATNLWRICYKLEYAPEGWTQLAEFEDQATHIIPADIGIRAPSVAQVLALTKSGMVGGADSGILAQVPKRLPFSALSLPNV